ncbi:MAG: hypothetical protein LV479_09005 [Methylacidiphilales bacterium]|nr:hypothetical protein [Candidatus Methylacidiphilales bacterium]
MRISLNNIWLTNDGSAALQTWTDAHDVRLNGRQMVQDAEFLRAVAAQPLARGNLVNLLQFTVTRQHASVAAAAAFLLTAFGSLPTSGQATIVCGAYGESTLTCTFSAVLEAMPESVFHGTRTDTTFVLRGGTITSLSPLVESAVDGASFQIGYGAPQGGTLDGGNLADALAPSTLDLDGGAFS